MKKNQIVIRSAVRKNKTALSAALLSHPLLLRFADECGGRRGYNKIGQERQRSVPVPKALAPAHYVSSSLAQPKAPLCFAQSSVPKALGPSTSKQRIKNTAYQGEIGRKVELSKRRKIKRQKKISMGFVSNSYTNSPGGLSSRELSRGLRPSIHPLCGKAEKRCANAPKVSDNFKKYILYFKKKTWYTDKAAPIPGGNQKLSTGFVRKEKFYKKIFRAYRLFKTYQNLSKKRLKKQCVKSSRTKDQREFSTIMHMDSLFYCRMGKSRLKATTATGATRYATNRELSVPINRSPYFLNGKYITKKNFVLYRKNKVLTHRASGLKDGDFCIGN